MYRRVFPILILCMLCLCSACGTSDEKIAQAQQKYAELANIHNQVVEAHKEISDASLDQELVELKEEVSGLESYNLAEMKNEEIDRLIQTMDELIASYGDYLELLSDIKGEEEAAVLTPITIAITNHTTFSFSGIKLYEKGQTGSHANALEGLEPLAPEQSMTGLALQRDADDTPWILILTDLNDHEYELELPVKEYEKEGVSLNLVYDAEQDEIRIE